jgi:hypothetical protein
VGGFAIDPPVAVPNRAFMMLSREVLLKEAAEPIRESSPASEVDIDRDFRLPLRNSELINEGRFFESFSICSG